MREMKGLRPMAAACLLAFAAGPDPALALPGDRITAFTLSSGGVAEVHRSVRVQGGEPLELSVPKEQVDDLLKSLVVHDPQGRVRHLVLDGEAPVQELFERLPFGPQDLASPARLAARLPGVALRATSGGRTVQGSVLGVREPAAPAGRDSAELAAAQLSVLTAEGQVQVLRLGPDTVLDILDESLKGRLQAALQASGRHQAGTDKTLRIVLEGQGERDVQLIYVMAAPVWKSAYRLLTRDGGQARLQAWAVLENATGQDWKDVRITLVSGAPVVLSQALYARYWNTRPELPLAVGAAALPTADTLAERAVAAYAAAPAPMVAAAPMSKSLQRARAADAQRESAARRAAMAEPSVEAAVAQEGQVSVRYALPSPVSAAAGQTVSVPFIDAALTAEPLAVFQPQRGAVHPVAAVWLKNDTPGSLPPGILTVYDEASGHIGDAQMVALPAGESRMVYFAEDRKVEVRSEELPQARVSAFSLGKGVLTIRREVQRETRYAIKGAPDAARTVVIEHPRRDGWTFKSDALSGETARHHRLRVTVPAGGQASVQALATRSERQSMALLDTGAEDILQWSGQVADEKTRAALASLAQLRRALSDAQQREKTLADRLDSAMANQARVRDNLSAVPADSELGQRYLKVLAEAESAIEALLGQRDEAREETARRRRALQDEVISGGTL